LRLRPSIGEYPGRQPRRHDLVEAAKRISPWRDQHGQRARSSMRSATRKEGLTVVENARGKSGGARSAAISRRDSGAEAERVPAPDSCWGWRPAAADRREIRRCRNKCGPRAMAARGSASALSLRLPTLRARRGASLRFKLVLPARPRSPLSWSHGAVTVARYACALMPRQGQPCSAFRSEPLQVATAAAEGTTVNDARSRRCWRRWIFFGMADGVPRRHHVCHNLLRHRRLS